ncbi:MAG TPA: 2-amino-4-hydroxy-6-hydroxymethyldihydropteridine diphosphokinase [Vicinamibacterales bacterium]|nr:2-amino-4-hydroxy-6-hydroxymethyldihydropteridine diphosphokinase [Vicinamibacterales bacterium]
MGASSRPAGSSSARCAVALGSNLGDRRAHLDFAVARLRAILDGLKVSGYFETDPVSDVPQPRYLNAAAVGRTSLSARDLLTALLKIERERGRERPFKDSPRTLDLDLILYGDLVLTEPGLTLPHPRFRDRLFVLEPLTSIAPDLVDPVTRKTVTELLSGPRTKD